VAEARSRAVDLQPVLRGDLLELRPLRAEDFDGLFSVAADPLVWEQHPVKDRHEEDAFRSFFREQLESGGTLVAVDRADGSIVGSSRFHAYDEATSELEIGWTFLARSHWGGVYNREMKRLMLRHAFRFVDNVVFLVDPQNVRSQRAVEKIGAVRFGSRLDAGGRDSVAYRISAATFAADGRGVSSRPWRGRSSRAAGSSVPGQWQEVSRLRSQGSRSRRRTAAPRSSSCGATVPQI
jgi:RimJ/RimL family protein N-acetyltransferase